MQKTNIFSELFTVKVALHEVGSASPTEEITPQSQQPTANQLCENQKLITQEKGITPSWRGSSQILNNLHCK